MITGQVSLAVKRILNFAFVVLAIFGLHDSVAQNEPGSSRAGHSVSSSGQFQYTIPIQAPKGVNGVTPELSLSYSSSQDSGLLGVGWSLAGLPSIERCGSTIATNGVRGGVQHNSADRYCLGGNQLLAVNGVYGADGTEYRTEVDGFSKVVSYGSAANRNGGTSPLYWRVYHKNGDTWSLGESADSRYRLPGTGSIHRWSLWRQYDRNDNYYQVTYENSEGLPARIDYTRNDSQGLVSNQAVTFAYEVRNDTRFRYIAGVKVNRIHRLKKVTLQQGSSVAREYRLAYQYGTASKRSRLISVTECGMNNECFAPVTVDWESETVGFRTASNVSDKPHIFLTRTDWLDDRQETRVGQWIDVNGDGRIDHVRAYTNPWGATDRRTWLKTDSGWTLSGGYQLPTAIRSYDESLNMADNVMNMGQFVDVNGDRLVDWVVSYRYYDSASSQVKWERSTWLNTGSGWQQDTRFLAPDPIYDYRANYYNQETVRGRFVDLNGDGLVEWVRAYYGDITKISYRKTAINTGSGWYWDGTDNYTLPDDIYGTRMQEHGDFIDVNGDGLPDWVQAYRNKDTGTHTKTWLNTGAGWSYNAMYNAPGIVHDYGYSDESEIRHGDFIDINSDGFVDWLQSYINPHTGQTYTKAALNTGRGWAWNTDYEPPFVKRNYNGDSGWPTEERGYYLDVNRDGLLDYQESYRGWHGTQSFNTWINTGSGWRKDNAYNVGWWFNDYYDTQGKAGIRYGEFADIDSNGSVDWTHTHVNHLNARVNRLGKVDQIDRITSNLGVKYEPKFAPLTDTEVYSRDSFASETLTAESDAAFVQGSIYVIERLKVSSPIEGSRKWLYNYAGAQVSRTGRGFLGFKYRQVEDTRRDTTEVTEYRQDFPFIGRASKQSVDHNDQVLSMVTTTLDNRTTAYGSSGTVHFPHTTQSLTQEYELNGQTVRSDYRTFVYDDFGNVTESLEQRGREPGDVQAQLHSITTYKAPDLSNWYVNLPIAITETQTGVSGPGVVRTTHNQFDSKGRLIESIREPDGDDTIKQVSSWQYDAYGNVVSETIRAHNGIAMESRTTTTVYDSGSRLPAQVTNTLGHVRSYTYHPVCSTLENQTDVNGLVTSYSYDNLCREISRTHPDLTTLTTSYLSNDEISSAVCGQCDVKPVFKTTTQTTGEPAVEVFYNTYNQVVMTQTQGMSGTLINTYNHYDRLGRLISETAPHYAGDAQYAKEYSYDILDRRIEVQYPFLNEAGTSQAVSTVNYGAANGLREHVFVNVKGQSTTTKTNALGQVVEVVDTNNKSLSFTYDAQGNTKTTQDALGNTTSIEFDRLGRRTALNDMDLGRWEYVYNGFDELIEQTDAKGQAIEMQFDALGRMTQRKVPVAGSSNSVEISAWQYDVGSKAIGQLSQVSGANGYLYSITYDALGRASNESYVIGGETFTQSVTYDNAGRLASQTYPEGLTVSYGYTNGYLSTLTESGSGEVLWQANEYNARGRLVDEALGLLSTQRQYDDARNVLLQIGSVAGSSTVQDLVYEYDTLNNLMKRQDHVQSIQEQMTYDDLNRLTRYRRTGITQQTQGGDPVMPFFYSETDVAYDAIGNITYKSDVGTYRYSNGRPHAVSRVDLPLDSDALEYFTVPIEWGNTIKSMTPPDIHGVDYSYDANGNLLQSGDRMVYWTAFNKPSTMQRVLADGTVTRTDFEYGPSFERTVKTASTNDQTVYVGEGYERIEKQGEVVHRYTLVAGSSSVQIDRKDNEADAVRYLLSDHQGSTDVIVDASGQVEQRMAFDPWGMRRSLEGESTPVNGLTTVGYTGHEMDDEVGMINMNARIYDPYLGRFLSADTIVADAHNMQSYNRYSYVYNNPLKYTDPTGHYVSVDGNGTGDDAGGVNHRDPDAPVRGGEVDARDNYINGGCVGCGRLPTYVFIPYEPVIPEATGSLSGSISSLWPSASSLSATQTSLDENGIPSVPDPTQVENPKPTASGYDFEIDWQEVERFMNGFPGGKLVVAAPLAIGKAGTMIGGKLGSKLGTNLSGQADELAKFDDLAADAAGELAAFRNELGLPAAGSVADRSTLAMMEVNGKKIFGVNGHGQPVSGVNAISKTHAEIDVLNQIKQQGINVKGRKLTLHVDRDPCIACGQNGGIRSMANQLGIGELRVIGPSGSTLIKP